MNFKFFQKLFGAAAVSANVTGFANCLVNKIRKFGDERRCATEI